MAIGAWERVRAEVAALAATFDAGLLSPADAERLVREVAAVEHMAAAVKARAASRAAEGGGWRRNGARSPEHDLARQTGSSVARARDLLETARRLDSLPSVDAAVRSGRLSPDQAGPIADAASADPAAEARLVRRAARVSLGELRDECARVKGRGPARRRRPPRRIHRGRFLRRRRGADGAGEIQYRSTVDEVAEVFSVIQGFANRAFDDARAAGRQEPEEAHLADGLLAACRSASRQTEGGAVAGTVFAAGAARRRRRPTPTKVIVRIDWDALVRGFPIQGEVSEIAGLGPIAVSAVRAMMTSGDAFLAGVVTKGQDVANVFHLGRRPTVYQGTALEWLAPTCTTEGCNNGWRLETDHREDWARTKVTLLRWLEHHCERCHDLKTRRGWALVEGTGKRPLVPPDDPRHPAHGARAAPARSG